MRPKSKTLEKLPQGAKGGTSSLRRKAQLLHARPDLQISDLRGNVNTRLEKLEREHFDAIILAVAGLKRLGFADRITEVLPREIVLPAVGQGALAIETREDDCEVRNLIAFLNNEATVACARAERAFLARVVQSFDKRRVLLWQVWYIWSGRVLETTASSASRQWTA